MSSGTPKAPFEDDDSDWVQAATDSGHVLDHLQLRFTRAIYLNGTGGGLRNCWIKSSVDPAIVFPKGVSPGPDAPFDYNRLEAEPITEPRSEGSNWIGPAGS